jgi:hypothetical protein
MKDNDEKLISDFMGYEFISERAPGKRALVRFGKVTAGARFNESWDWLMPVVEKIADMMPHINMPDDLEALKNGTHGSEQHIEVLSLSISSKITEVHEAVVKFITWYNSQPSPPSEQKPNEGPIPEDYYLK